MTAEPLGISYFRLRQMAPLRNRTNAAVETVYTSAMLGPTVPEQPTAQAKDDEPL